MIVNITTESVEKIKVR